MNSTRQISVQFVLGLSVILIGTLLILDNLDLISARNYLRYWPALLVLVGLVQLAQPRRTPGRVMGLILVSVGGLMLLDRFHLIDFSFWDLWPVIIIIFGLSLLRGSRMRGGIWTGRTESDADSYVRGIAILGGYERRNTSGAFQGGELTAVMGGCELDLRGATMEGDEATIDVFAMWGGISIKVPEDWAVVVNVVPIMGGVEDKSRPVKTGKIKRLVLTGYAIMGGVEIKN